MTIALGLLAQDGAVMAADREEGDEKLKSDQGKIGAVWGTGRGSLAVSGAGNGPYLDSLTQILEDWFRSDDTDFHQNKIGEELRRKNYEFYKRSVLPFAPYEEAVDYELLVCFDPAPTKGDIALAAKWGGIPGASCSLWKSHKLSLLKVEPFAAVGYGATMAKALLSKFWMPSMGLEIAISLAAYVTYQVKRTVKDVGLDTDILVMRRNHLPLHVNRHEISEMEARFEEYSSWEGENLYYCFGGDLAQHEHIMGKPGGHKGREKSLRKFFENLNKARLKQWAVPKT